VATIEDFLLPGIRQLDPAGNLVGPVTGPLSLAEYERLLVLDLEMSGANPQMHEVLDAGAVLVAIEPGFAELQSWGARVRPKHIGNAEPGALRVVGYSPKKWRDAIELEEAFARLAQFAPGALVTGWGIAQDLAFLAGTCRRLGLEWPFATLALDIQGIARKMLDASHVDRFNLGHVADRLGIGRMGEHGALADAYAAYDLLVKLHERAVA
jgi:DNA polymerase-3 subunit epsilon